eukprot:5439605-Amphidinium_carterae.1
MAEVDAYIAQERKAKEKQDAHDAQDRKAKEKRDALEHGARRLEERRHSTTLKEGIDDTNTNSEQSEEEEPRSRDKCIQPLTEAWMTTRVKQLYEELKHAKAKMSSMSKQMESTREKIATQCARRLHARAKSTAQASHQDAADRSTKRKDYPTDEKKGVKKENQSRNLVQN